MKVLLWLQSYVDKKGAVFFLYKLLCVFYKQYICGNNIPFVRHCRVRGIDKSRWFF